MKGYVASTLQQQYAGRLYVGIDLHRSRSVIVRTTAAGDVLEAVQIPEHAAGAGAGDVPGR